MNVLRERSVSLEAPSLDIIAYIERVEPQRRNYYSSVLA